MCTWKEEEGLWSELAVSPSTLHCFILVLVLFGERELDILCEVSQPLTPFHWRTNALKAGGFSHVVLYIVTWMESFSWKKNALGWVPGSFKSTFNFTICLIVPFRLPFPGVLHFSVLSRPPLHSYCCTGFLCFSLLPSVFQHFVPLSENDSWKRKSLSPSGQPKTKMPVWLGSLAGIRWLNASPAKSEDRTSLSFSFTKPLIL